MTRRGGAGGMSGGTKASRPAPFWSPVYRWHGGRLVTERGAARVHSFELSRPLAAGDLGGRQRGFRAALGFHPGLREVDVYLGGFGAASRAISIALRWGLRRDPHTRRQSRPCRERSPAWSRARPAARRRGDEGARGAEIVAEALDAGGPGARRGPPQRRRGLHLHRRVSIAWAAERAAAGGLQGGRCARAGRTASASTPSSRALPKRACAGAGA